MKNKKILYGCLFILFGAVSLACFIFKYNFYLIIFGIATLLLLVLFIMEAASKTSEVDIYNREVENILRTYGPILVNTNDFPKLKDKSILRISILEDLIDAQIEMRKPVYYVRSDDSVAFYILNEDVFLVYFLKMDKDSECSLEIELKRNELINSLNLSKINDLEKTMIVETTNNSYRVSPIREKKEEPKKVDSNLTLNDVNEEIDNKTISKKNETKKTTKKSSAKSKKQKEDKISIDNNRINFS